MQINLTKLKQTVISSGWHNFFPLYHWILHFHSATGHAAQTFCELYSLFWSIYSRLHTMHPQSLSLTIGRTVMKEYEDLHILECHLIPRWGEIFYEHLRSVSRAAFRMLGILRKSWQVFNDRLLLERYFWGFDLLVLESCTLLQCGA